MPYKMFDTLPIKCKEEKKARVYFAVTGQLWNVLAEAKHDPCSVRIQYSSPAQRGCQVSKLQPFWSSLDNPRNSELVPDPPSLLVLMVKCVLVTQ